MKRFTTVLAIGSLLLTAGRATAANGVSTYTKNQLGAYATNNSVANYSVNRIRGKIFNSVVPNYNFSSKNYRTMFNSSLSGVRRGKPFAGRAASSSVTPWLALSDPFSSSGHNYYTQVRPQLEQQRANQQAAAQSARIQQQAASLEATPPYDPSGSDKMTPTGHGSAYMNYGGYYPPAQVQRKHP